MGGKPLPIGGDGKGPDARFGRGAGATASGYKSHAIWPTRPAPEAWDVKPLGANGKALAAGLAEQLRYGG